MIPSADHFLAAEDGSKPHAKRGLWGGRLGLVSVRSRVRGLVSQTHPAPGHRMAQAEDTVLLLPFDAEIVLPGCVCKECSEQCQGVHHSHVV